MLLDCLFLLICPTTATQNVFSLSARQPASPAAFRLGADIGFAEGQNFRPSSLAGAEGALPAQNAGSRMSARNVMAHAQRDAHRESSSPLSSTHESGGHHRFHHENGHHGERHHVTHGEAG